jgi:hypothetical protein
VNCIIPGWTKIIKTTFLNQGDELFQILIMRQSVW